VKQAEEKLSQIKLHEPLGTFLFAEGILFTMQYIKVQNRQVEIIYMQWALGSRRPKGCNKEDQQPTCMKEEELHLHRYFSSSLSFQSILRPTPMSLCY